MNRRGIGIRLTCLCVLAAASPAFAAPEGDWPCIQPRVVTLGVAQMWSGPPLDQAFARWRDDAEVAALVRSLVPRRVTMDEAAAAIDRFAAAAGPQKTEKLTLLFAGLFEIINADRQRLVGGIERYARRQRALSEDIGETARTLSDASIPASQKESDRRKAALGQAHLRRTQPVADLCMRDARHPRTARLRPGARNRAAPRIGRSLTAMR